MEYLVLDERVKPYGGRYPFDLGDNELTTREWGWIKRHSGYLPLTIEEGFAGGDPELFAVFATMALVRAGRITRDEFEQVFSRIVDAPFATTIRLESDTPEESGSDAGPPVSSLSGNDSISGTGSQTSSETSTGTPNGSGTPASDISAWELARSGT